MLAATINEAARRWDNRTAYVATAGWSLSYEELDRFSDEAAVGLAGRGVGLGDVMALVLPACPEYFVLYAAATKLGAVTAGVNTRLKMSDRARVLQLATPKLVVTDESTAGPAGADVVVIDPAHGADALLPTVRSIGERPVPLPDDPERPIAIVFTSGTTGTPKGAVFAGRQLAFIARIDTGGTWGPGGHTLSGTSLAHLGPMTKFPGNLMRGMTTHLAARWSAANAIRLVALHRMAGIGGIPTQLALMIRDPAFDQYDLSCLKAIVIGGGPATPALVREIRERTGAAVSVRYSCTEAGIGVGTAFDADTKDAEVSVGRPHAGVTITIVGDNLTEMAPGEAGEVCISSPAVMNGYWRDPAASSATFTPDGAIRTGDVGYIDDHGRLCLSGRIKEMYVRGGYNVFPAAVEAALAGHPQVAEVAVTPRVDDVMGEIGVAVVVPTDPAAPPDLESLRQFAGNTLPRHELPEDLRIADALPLTAMDKLDRRALADLA
jgi:acyl-CoA synthetase (AMP-forming)/AMP-acid ligase II